MSQEPTYDISEKVRFWPISESAFNLKKNKVAMIAGECWEESFLVPDHVF